MGQLTPCMSGSLRYNYSGEATFQNRGSSRRGRAKTFFGGRTATLGAEKKGLGVPGGGPSRLALTLDNRSKGLSLRGPLCELT